jgi:hypothetical protein
VILSASGNSWVMIDVPGDFDSGWLKYADHIELVYETLKY